MSDIVICILCGVYRTHKGIVGYRSSVAEAVELAIETVKAESDSYHNVELIRLLNDGEEYVGQVEQLPLLSFDTRLSKVNPSKMYYEAMDAFLEEVKMSGLEVPEYPCHRTDKETASIAVVPDSEVRFYKKLVGRAVTHIVGREPSLPFLFLRKVKK